jgi:hypothetical protein
MAQAWLLPVLDPGEAGRHALEVKSILTDLPRMLGPALPAGDCERLRESLLAQRDEWDRAFASPGHLTEVEDTARQLQEDLYNAQHGDCQPPTLRQEHWLKALGWVEGFAKRLVASVEAALDERCIQAMHLGRWAGRGARPRAVYRFMCWPAETGPDEPEDAVRGVSPFRVPADYPGATHEPVEGTGIAPWLLRPVTEGAIPPEGGWLDELQRCWEEIGIPGDFPKSFPPPKGDAQVPQSERVNRYIASLDELIRDELNDMAPRGKIPAEERTRPLTRKEAARLLGVGTDRKAVEALGRMIKHGTVQCESLSRQQHVFRKSAFPKEVWDQLERR